MRVVPSDGNLDKREIEEKKLAFCLLVFFLAGKFICSVAVTAVLLADIITSFLRLLI